MAADSSWGGTSTTSAAGSASRTSEAVAVAVPDAWFTTTTRSFPAGSAGASPGGRPGAGSCPRVGTTPRRANAAPTPSAAPARTSLG